MSQLPRHHAAVDADTDVIDALAGLSPESRVARLRHGRDEVRRFTQASFAALFEPQDAKGLPATARELAALRVATLQRNPALAAFHRRRAGDLGADAPLLALTEKQPVRPIGSDLWTAVLRFVDRLTLEPAAAKPAHLQELQRLGLAPRDIVTLAQLIAFVNYQVRVLAGLRALADLPAAVAVPPAEPAALLRGHHPVPAQLPSARGFTTDTLEWKAWLPTVDATQATPEQVAVLDESNAAARTSPYYLTLVHDPAVLRQRSKLFNAIMYGPGGLPRAERELATVAVSIVNGCPYCASVHSRLFAQLSKEPEAVQALFDEGLNAALSPRRRALVDLGAALSANPPASIEARLAALRAAGVDDPQALDALHAAAIFAWANRLMQTLGEPVTPAH